MCPRVKKVNKDKNRVPRSPGPCSFHLLSHRQAPHQVPPDKQPIDHISTRLLFSFLTLGPGKCIYYSVETVEMGMAEAVKKANF